MQSQDMVEKLLQIGFSRDLAHHERSIDNLLKQSFQLNMPLLDLPGGSITYF
jgi:hypothetical protein